MKKEFFYYLVFIAFLFVNCNSNNKKENEIVVLDAHKNEIKIDTTLIAVADLPIKIDSISYLIHPVGYYKSGWYDDEYSSKSSRSGSNNFTISNNYDDKIKGNMFNLFFQKENSSELKPLTDKNIKIRSVSFLRGLFNNTKKKILVYEIIDTDTNEDKTIDLQDLYSIYISNIDGSNFRKISKLNHRIITYKFLNSNNTFYFKTLEKAKSKEVKQILHYFFADLSKKEILVKEYFPLKNN